MDAVTDRGRPPAGLIGDWADSLRHSVSPGVLILAARPGSHLLGRAARR